MYLIIGLGNPGTDYDGTRHNVGRDVVRGCADTWKTEKKLFAEIAKQYDVVYALPTTYMNDSGRAVRAVMSTVKCQLSNVIIVHDDIDLPLGTLRISHDSGAGGHNGVQSIIDALGSKEFTRVRIGVAGVGRTRTDAATYVLKRFPKTELPVIKEMKNKTREALSVILSNGVKKAMQEYNALTKTHK